LNNLAKQISNSHDNLGKVTKILHARTRISQERNQERLQRVLAQQADVWKANPLWPWTSGTAYAVDFAQRSVLFWDTLRQRGNNFVEHERQGMPPVLHFKYETVMDGRTLKRPVNYALLRIVPPEGVTVDPTRRPYVVMDPRGGHGPGIGGFKDDSQVGVALQAGHPVYFVVFFPNPEPGQTLLDVCDAEREFVRCVRGLHPNAPKPALIGNCQGGWAAMMLASASPDDIGPVVIVGAPMSYWGGAWREGEGDNPMRYAGGLLGGTWLASLTSDLGAGKFDGAWLVQNFESLNPANTFWDKYYQVFANVDTESARFLEFERWWGGYYLLNREEIEWITQNLFVGNRLWSGTVNAGQHALDLREIKVPIVMFASLGDNITPPQQAFNWVADVYKSTEEIKARGQVIVGLLQEDVGHLGIFVSGKVAKKEYTQIVSVLKSIEALAPGLYGMEITESKDASGKLAYDVRFVEQRLEEVVGRLNRFKRADERPFEAVKVVSELNQKVYELFGRPVVKSFANEYGARLGRDFHPLRFQRWAFSDLNPALWALGPTAKAVKAQRRALPPEHPARALEAAQSEVSSAALDLFRGTRDAMSEAAFFLIYGNLHTFNFGGGRGSDTSESAAADPREQSWVRESLASMEEGGYPEALARIACLLAPGDEPLPLSKLQLAHKMLEEHRELLPSLPPADVRRIAGRQQIIVRYEPEKALKTLPALLKSPKDRERLLLLCDRVFADERVQRTQPTIGQKEMLGRIRAVLGATRQRLFAVAARRPSGSTRNARTAGRILKAKGKEKSS
jgi:pimeloyl-ACP methyl ester carboxylesterase